MHHIGDLRVKTTAGEDVILLGAFGHAERDANGKMQVTKVLVWEEYPKVVHLNGVTQSMHPSNLIGIGNLPVETIIR